MNIIAEIMSMAKELRASNAEKEVERLLKIVLRGTPFSNKVHGVGGYVAIISLYYAHNWR